MAFTYVGDLASNRDRVRFYLQDTTDGSGPKPADANFSDDEIDGLVTVEGSWQKAVAAGLDILAAAWQRFPNFTADGLTVARSDIAKGYSEKAATWRKQYGLGTSSTRAGSRAMTRVDGYSDDVTNQET